MPTLFLAFANLCQELEGTTKRKTMVSLVASFIKQLETEEINPAVSMLMGRVFPEWDQRVLEISWATINAAIRKIMNCGNKVLSRAFSKTGDVGEAVKIIFEESRIRKQATLFQSQLTILEVQRTFQMIAETTGIGSREKKERLLETLLSSATPLEAKYLVKILIGEMRTGFHEGLMEMSIAESFGISLNVVQTSSMLRGDIGEVAAIAKIGGKENLLKLGFQVFRPIKPMLAQIASSFGEALEEHGGRTSFEYKLDGARIQIHKQGDVVKIFSRRLSEVTESLPEIVELIRNEINANDAILEGEVIAVDAKGSPLLFQHLMRRFRRVRKIQEAMQEVPVQLFLFDALYINGESLINRPYVDRREKLSEITKQIALTKQNIAENVEEAEQFFEEAVKSGHEGLMAKNLESTYTPGIRGKGWFKIKKILAPLDLVIVAAEYGYGRRHGWLSDYYLAARDLDSGNFVTVGKTFKGLTDVEIIEMTERLRELTIGPEDHKVVVMPKIVVEVAYNEIQRSPKYKCGMALRFARIVRVREDKDVGEADTLQRIKEIFERQFEKKGKWVED